MKQRLQKVRIEDFNVAALRKAAREGRLYIKPAVESQINVEQEVLTYVNRIAEYAAPPYREYIEEVWRRIVAHPLLSIRLTSRKESFCKYAVTAIAIFLNNKRIYTFHSGMALHLQLDDTNIRNKHYKNSMKYAPNKREYYALCCIIKDIFGENS